MTSAEGVFNDVDSPFKGHGYIEKIEKNVISGWACDLNHLNTSIVLEVRSSSGKSIIALADIYRRDVHEAQFGNGRHGFSIDLEKLNLEDETITVYYLDDNSPLNETPIDFDPERALLNSDLNPRFAQNIMLLAAKTRQKFNNMMDDGMLGR
jgi:hypothetical protein